MRHSIQPSGYRPRDSNPRKRPRSRTRSHLDDVFRNNWDDDEELHYNRSEATRRCDDSRRNLRRVPTDDNRKTSQDQESAKRLCNREIENEPEATVVRDVSENNKQPCVTNNENIASTSTDVQSTQNSDLLSNIVTTKTYLTDCFHEDTPSVSTSSTSVSDMDISISSVELTPKKGKFDESCLKISEGTGEATEETNPEDTTGRNSLMKKADQVQESEPPEHKVSTKESKHSQNTSGKISETETSEDKLGNESSNIGSNDLQKDFQRSSVIERFKEPTKPTDTPQSTFECISSTKKVDEVNIPKFSNDKAKNAIIRKKERNCAMKRAEAAALEDRISNVSSTTVTPDENLETSKQKLVPERKPVEVDNKVDLLYKRSKSKESVSYQITPGYTIPKKSQSTRKSGFSDIDDVYSQDVRKLFGDTTDILVDTSDHHNSILPNPSDDDLNIKNYQLSDTSKTISIHKRNNQSRPYHSYTSRPDPVASKINNCRRSLDQNSVLTDPSSIELSLPPNISVMETRVPMKIAHRRYSDLRLSLDSQRSESSRSPSSPFRSPTDVSSSDSYSKDRSSNSGRYVDRRTSTRSSRSMNRRSSTDARRRVHNQDTSKSSQSVPRSESSKGTDRVKCDSPSSQKSFPKTSNNIRTDPDNTSALKLGEISEVESSSRSPFSYKARSSCNGYRIPKKGSDRRHTTFSDYDSSSQDSIKNRSTVTTKQFGSDTSLESNKDCSRDSSYQKHEQKSSDSRGSSDSEGRSRKQTIAGDKKMSKTRSVDSKEIGSPKSKRINTTPKIITGNIRKKEKRVPLNDSKTKKSLELVTRSKTEHEAVAGHVQIKGKLEKMVKPNGGISSDCPKLIVLIAKDSTIKSTKLMEISLTSDADVLTLSNKENLDSETKSGYHRTEDALPTLLQVSSDGQDTETSKPNIEEKGRNNVFDKPDTEGTTNQSCDVLCEEDTLDNTSEDVDNQDLLSENVEKAVEPLEEAVKSIVNGNSVCEDTLRKLNQMPPTKEKGLCTNSENLGDENEMSSIEVNRKIELDIKSHIVSLADAHIDENVGVIEKLFDEKNVTLIPSSEMNIGIVESEILDAKFSTVNIYKSFSIKVPNESLIVIEFVRCSILPEFQFTQDSATSSFTEFPEFATVTIKKPPEVIEGSVKVFNKMNIEEYIPIIDLVDDKPDIPTVDLTEEAEAKQEHATVDASEILDLLVETAGINEQITLYRSDETVNDNLDLQATCVSITPTKPGNGTMIEETEIERVKKEEGEDEPDSIFTEVELLNVNRKVAGRVEVKMEVDQPTPTDVVYIKDELDNGILSSGNKTPLETVPTEEPASVEAPSQSLSLENVTNVLSADSMVLGNRSPCVEKNTPSDDVAAKSASVDNNTSRGASVREVTSPDKDISNGKRSGKATLRNIRRKVPSSLDMPKLNNQECAALRNSRKKVPSSLDMPKLNNQECAAGDHLGQSCMTVVAEKTIREKPVPLESVDAQINDALHEIDQMIARRREDGRQVSSSKPNMESTEERNSLADRSADISTSTSRATILQNEVVQPSVASQSAVSPQTSCEASSSCRVDNTAQRNIPQVSQATETFRNHSQQNVDNITQINIVQPLSSNSHIILQRTNVVQNQRREGSTDTQPLSILQTRDSSHQQDIWNVTSILVKYLIRVHCLKACCSNFSKTLELYRFIDPKLYLKESRYMPQIHDDKVAEYAVAMKETFKRIFVLPPNPQDVLKVTLNRLKKAIPQLDMKWIIFVLASLMKLEAAYYDAHASLKYFFYYLNTASQQLIALKRQHDLRLQQQQQTQQQQYMAPEQVTALTNQIAQYQSIRRTQDLFKKGNKSPKRTSKRSTEGSNLTAPAPNENTLATQSRASFASGISPSTLRKLVQAIPNSPRVASGSHTFQNPTSNMPPAHGATPMIRLRDPSSLMQGTPGPSQTNMNSSMTNLEQMLDKYPCQNRPNVSAENNTGCTSSSATSSPMSCNSIQKHVYAPIVRAPPPPYTSPNLNTVSSQNVNPSRQQAATSSTIHHFSSPQRHMLDITSGCEYLPRPARLNAPYRLTNNRITSNQSVTGCIPSHQMSGQNTTVGASVAPAHGYSDRRALPNVSPAQTEVPSYSVGSSPVISSPAHQMSGQGASTSQMAYTPRGLPNSHVQMTTGRSGPQSAHSCVVRNQRDPRTYAPTALPNPHPYMTPSHRGVSNQNLNSVGMSSAQMSSPAHQMLNQGESTSGRVCDEAMLANLQLRVTPGQSGGTSRNILSMGMSPAQNSMSSPAHQMSNQGESTSGRVCDEAVLPNLQVRVMPGQSGGTSRNSLSMGMSPAQNSMSSPAHQMSNQGESTSGRVCDEAMLPTLQLRVTPGQSGGTSRNILSMGMSPAQNSMSSPAHQMSNQGQSTSGRVCDEAVLPNLQVRVMPGQSGGTSRNSLSMGMSPAQNSMSSPAHQMSNQGESTSGRVCDEAVLPNLQVRMLSGRNGGTIRNSVSTAMSPAQNSMFSPARRISDTPVAMSGRAALPDHHVQMTPTRSGGSNQNLRSMGMTPRHLSLSSPAHQMVDTADSASRREQTINSDRLQKSRPNRNAVSKQYHDSVAASPANKSPVSSLNQTGSLAATISKNIILTGTPVHTSSQNVRIDPLARTPAQQFGTAQTPSHPSSEFNTPVRTTVISPNETAQLAQRGTCATPHASATPVSLRMQLDDDELPTRNLVYAPMLVPPSYDRLSSSPTVSHSPDPSHVSEDGNEVIDLTWIDDLDEERLDMEVEEMVKKEELDPEDDDDDVIINNIDHFAVINDSQKYRPEL
ncbi:unnamed protein product [Acanthoscelides obtectus]|uniref:Uncharacterized protein n=1 Tax=Acanthoscelides obtectus TaxID=200917 RepID=A0A9P0L1Q4_ACAOB|nr:unnamed protein product [Acanthoscelides obtectus]CAK1626453.1 hypothetical protein AOBTE_LOCUS3853 [Acanthoscelides obtectus]